MTIPGQQQFVNMQQSPTSFMQNANQSFGIPTNMINASTPHAQSTLGSQRAVSNADLLQFMNSKFDDITKRLQKLEDLETKVIEVDSKLSRLWSDLDKRVTNNTDTARKTEEKVDETNFALGKALEEVNSLKTKNDELKDLITDLQSKNMMKNLIVGGITDSADERNEDTENSVRKFLVEKLKIAEERAKNIQFEKVQRISRAGFRPRGIIGCFSDMRDKDNVKSCRGHLKDTGYYMHDQYHREVVQYRKKLLPLVKKAKDDNKDVYIRYNKLIVAGREYTGGKYGPLP